MRRARLRNGHQRGGNGAESAQSRTKGTVDSAHNTGVRARLRAHRQACQLFQYAPTVRAGIPQESSVTVHEGEPYLVFARFRDSIPRPLLFRRDRNCQQGKGLPIFPGQFAALPGAVREYEIQELPLFGCGLTLEQGVGASSRNWTPVDIAAVGRLGRPQIANDGRMCRAHLSGLGTKKSLAIRPSGLSSYMLSMRSWSRRCFVLQRSPLLH